MTKFQPRRSTRYNGFDYSSAGAYFVTMVTRNRTPLFGAVDGRTVALSAAGLVIDEEWRRTAEVRVDIRLDAYVVMPNHFHDIIWITDDHGVGATGMSPSTLPRRSLGSFVAGFKGQTAARINRWRGTPGQPVWQRGYYD